MLRRYSDAELLQLLDTFENMLERCQKRLERHKRVHECDMPQYDGICPYLLELRRECTTIRAMQQVLALEVSVREILSND